MATSIGLNCKSVVQQLGEVADPGHETVTYISNQTCSPRNLRRFGFELSSEPGLWRKKISGSSSASKSLTIVLYKAKLFTTEAPSAIERSELRSDTARATGPVRFFLELPFNPMEDLGLSLANEDDLRVLLHSTDTPSATVQAVTERLVALYTNLKSHRQDMTKSGFFRFYSGMSSEEFESVRGLAQMERQLVHLLGYPDRFIVEGEGDMATIGQSVAVRESQSK